MARPLRVEYAGALYHVMNRGNRRERVFRKVADYALFLSRLDRFSAEFDVEVLSYCLMPNHFHLFLRTRGANLSRFMQSLLTSFTVAMNRRDKSCGHLFQGRFNMQDRVRAAFAQVKPPARRPGAAVASAGRGRCSAGRR